MCIEFSLNFAHLFMHIAQQSISFRNSEQKPQRNILLVFDFHPNIFGSIRNSEFGIIVSRYAGRYLKEIYNKIHRVKEPLSPCVISIKVF